MVVTTGCHHLLGAEDLAAAPGAGAQLCLAHDGSGVQGHRLGLGLLPVDQLIAVHAVDLVVRPVSEVGRVHLVLALDAGEAPPVVAAWLGDLLLGLEDPACAAGTDVCVPLLSLQLGAVGVVQVGLGLVAMGVGVAVLAVDVIVGTL